LGALTINPSLTLIIMAFFEAPTHAKKVIVTEIFGSEDEKGTRTV